MKRATVFAAGTALFLASAIASPAQESAHKARIITPESAIERPEDIGLRAHTPYRILVPANRTKFGADPNSIALPSAVDAAVGPPLSGFAYETPASLACIYHLVAVVAGCNPNTFLTNPTGGSKAIGIVDAFDYPTAMADLNAFSKQFGLPAVTATNFKVLFAGGTDGCSGADPGNNAGWEGEQALDIEMVHAMAPKAIIFLVEAQTNSFTDLMTAEDCASKKVAAAGGGEVTNSWGGSEFSGETTLDTHFTTANVVYFASTGDSAGTEWPSVSKNVVAVGGTTTSRVNTAGATFGNFIGEAAWEEGGGGVSPFESRPAYQKLLPAGPGRHVPDVSSDANPNTGVWVYDNNATTGCCWYVFGGTSVASPTWAGIVNRAGHFAASTPIELQKIYGAYGVAASYAADYNDVAYGLCGFYDGFEAVTGWDPCTGIGSPKAYIGK
jgi:kumamolisin